MGFLSKFSSFVKFNFTLNYYFMDDENPDRQVTSRLEAEQGLTRCLGFDVNHNVKIFVF